MPLSPLLAAAFVLAQVSATPPPTTNQVPSVANQPAPDQAAPRQPEGPPADARVDAPIGAPVGAAGRVPAVNADPASPNAAPPAPPPSIPSDMLGGALTLPPGGTLSGQPLPLLTALASATDPRQQLSIIHAYWNLVEAAAVYHFCWDYDNQLQQLRFQPEEAALLSSARASAAALLQETEAAVAVAQHELAALAGLPAEAPLPWPADRPHVGPYRTSFKELFPGGTGPLQARSLDHILPMRQRAVDGRAAAIQAADEALKAVSESRAAGRAGIVDVVRCAGECLKQRQAWVISVCHYNHDIGDYAMAVIRPGASPQMLLGMLIKSNYESLPGIGLPVDAGVRPAGLTEPMLMPPQRPAKLQPTPAKRPPSAVPPGGIEPTFAPPPQQLPPMPTNEPTLAPPEPQPQVGPAQLAPAAGKNEPTVAPVEGSAPQGMR